MATTVQNVIDRAVDRNIANRGSSLTQSTIIMTHRVNQDAIRLRQQLLERNASFFFHEETKASTAAASGRVLDLDALTSTQKVGRLIMLKLPSGTEISVVDYRDMTGALAPRGYPKKKTIVEVSNEWDTASSSAVTVTVAYNIGCTPLTLSAATTQPVTIDDEYSWLLDNRLAAYLAQKDVGRSSDEIKMLDAEYASGFEDYMAWLTNIGGPQVLQNPPTVPNEKT